VDGERVGRDLRLLRIRRRWRQRDVAARAACSQAQVSRIERGLITGVTIGRLDAIAAALGARFVGTVLWQGERLDRLRDERHAALVDSIVRLLQADGWLVAPEVSFAVFGERGSIDVLAFHPVTRILLVVEVKTAFGDVQANLGTLDRKDRLAMSIGRDRGWNAIAVNALLAVADTSTNRRVVARHQTTFAAALPVRGRNARRLIRAPRPGRLRGLLFLSPIRGMAGSRGSRFRPSVRTAPMGVIVHDPSGRPLAASGSGRVQVVTAARCMADRDSARTAGQESPAE